jgi:GNAT superfamily N-acetyltransferase
MTQTHPIEFKLAEPKHAPQVAAMVFELLREMAARSGGECGVDLVALTRQCRDFLERGFYQALLVYHEGEPVGVATLAETYALYAGGKIGVIQEFYVLPDSRSEGLGARLMERVLAQGEKRGCTAFEVTTPPLPQFEDTLRFYLQQGFQPMGGRKMRVSIGGRKSIHPAEGEPELAGA